VRADQLGERFLIAGARTLDQFMLGDRVAGNQARTVSPV
jgi:hypothetical protein